MHGIGQKSQWETAACSQLFHPVHIPLVPHPGLAGEGFRVGKMRELRGLGLAGKRAEGSVAQCKADGRMKVAMLGAFSLPGAYAVCSFCPHR